MFSVLFRKKKKIVYIGAPMDIFFSQVNREYRTNDFIGSYE